MIQVIVASEHPIYLSVELLCARSGYFNTALNGGFEEGSANTVEIPWEGNAKNCVLFLYWLGTMDLTGDEFSQETLLLFLSCCSYFQVSKEQWTLVQQHVKIPNTYNELSETMKDIWNRQNLPFFVAQKLVDKVPTVLEKLEYMFAWFNEKTAVYDVDKQELESGEDFFRVREAVAGYLTAEISPPQMRQPGAMPGGMGMGFSQAPLPAQGLYGMPGQQAVSLTLSMLLTVVSRYPIIANCIETEWLLKQILTGSLRH